MVRLKNDTRWAPRWPYIAEKAIKALAITKSQAGRLFHVDNWPSPFKEDHDCGDQKGEAKAAAARIDYFIKERR